MSWQAKLLVDDTALPHEQKPHGVPAYYDWADKPVIQAGNIIPTREVTNPDGSTSEITYERMNPWGEIYTPAGGNPQPSALVEIRGLQGYVLANGAWQPLYTGPFKYSGSWYAEDFHGPIVYGPSDTTTIPGSVIGQPDNAGHLFPDGLEGVIACFWARLHAGSYDPLAVAPELIASVGADYWPTGNTGPAKGIGQGRFKTVKPWWRLFTFCTIGTVTLLRQPISTFSLDSGESV